MGLVVTCGREVLLLQRDDLLLEGADQLEPGAVTHVREAGIFVTTEVALADLAIGCAVEQRAVGLELPDPLWRLLGMQLGHAPGVEELATAHRVAEVDLPVVLAVDIAHRCGNAAFGHDCVGLAEQRLAHDGRALALVSCLDGSAEPGATGADHHNVVGMTLEVGHECPFGESSSSIRRRSGR